ncbi:hypothetical protein SDC9_08015 [bioreactor metagenome]|uniref:Uncharacterized protein n=1 Tax=bioreactor metagenome TaxID=1076179 RepID=A0A644T641_9ZZZZ|nr:hypothetical protein [Candidatus Elulimicrobiales bacterium]
MKTEKRLEDWQRPVSKLQIRTLVSSRNAINLITFEDFLNGKNPNYQSVAGRISPQQIERLKRFVESVEKGVYSHINAETVERFLSKEKPFGKDYFSLKKFAEKNKSKFFIWESVFYELKELATYPIKVTFRRSLKLYSELGKDMNRPKIIKHLGTEKTVFQNAPEIYEVTSFLKFENKIHRDGKWNYIPILNKDKEIMFLKIWVSRGIINLEIPDIDPMEFSFQKPERFFLVSN